MSSVSTLADACSDIVDCAHKTAPVDECGEFYAVGTPAMRGNIINYAEARRISRATFDDWTTRLRPRFGDLLLAREAPVGPVVRIPAAENVAPGQRTVLLRAREGVVDPHFLFYYLTAPTTQAALLVGASGSTVSHLNVADVRRLGTPGLPNLGEQHKIARVLGALDNKIAANRHQLEVAEQLADTIFAFDAAILPCGTVTLADVAEIGGGGTPRTSVDEYWNGDWSWATPTDVTALEAPYLDRTTKKITDAGLAACASALHPAGSILMTSRATIGAFAIAQVPMAVNQGFIVVNAKDITQQWWLFHDMRSRVEEFLAFANGAIFLELPRGRFKTLPVRIPSEEVLRKFNGRVAPLHALATALVRENRKLATTRDELLPLLMSGKIRVRDAERQAEDVL